MPPAVRARQQQKLLERYWLCNECAARWTLVCDRERGVILVALRRPAASVTTDVGSRRGVVA